MTKMNKQKQMQGKICLKDNVNINLKMQEKTGH